LGFGFAQVRFHVGGGLPDWVHVRTVRWQEQEPGSLFLQTLRGLLL
jgi:hypothetical protein